MIKKLSSGSYGTTYLSVDEKGVQYTIKFFTIRREKLKSGIYGQMNIKEIDFLVSYKHRNINSAHEILTSHPFIVKVDDNCILDKYCAVYEYAEKDLETYITQTNIRNVKDIMYQILSGVHFLHAHNIMHRDLKPGNILLYQGGLVKITDFGLSKFDTVVNKTNSIEVGTYGYISPEIFVKNGVYDCSVDIWSCGCILLALVKGKMFFDYPSQDSNDYLIDVFSRLTDERVSYMNTFDIVMEKGNKRKFSQIIKLTKAEEAMIGDPDIFYDLLDNMLSLNPLKRLNSYQCLIHPFFVDIKVPLQEELTLIYRNHYRISNPERTKTLKIFYSFLDNDKIRDYRIFFVSLNIFDRCLLTGAFKEFNYDVIAYASIYIGFKYFNVHSYRPIADLIFVPKKYSLHYLEKVETSLIQNYLKFEIYRPTIYDILQIKRLSHMNIIKLFCLMAEQDRVIGYNLVDTAEQFCLLI